MNHLTAGQLQERAYGDGPPRDSHLRSCPECRERLLLYERERELFEAWGRAEPARRPSRRVWYAAAAAAAVAALAWGLLPERSNPRTADRTRIEKLEPTPIETESRPGKRIVKMGVGRALFDVTPGEPFEVHTPAAVVRVLGTRFEVTAEADRTRVRVYEGTVDVDGPTGTVRATAGMTVRAERPQVRPDSPASLFDKASRLADPRAAAEWYGRALELARAAGDVEYFVRAAWFRAERLERLGRQGDALDLYRLVSLQGAAGDLAPLIARAREKLKVDGIDPLLEKLAQACAEWRAGPRSVKSLEGVKESVWEKIRAVGPRACEPLIEALGSREEQVAVFAADRLKFVLDEPGLAGLVAKLSSNRHAAGAAIALREAMVQIGRAKELEEAADAAELQIGFIAEGRSPEFAERVNRLRRELGTASVDEMRRQASALRGSLPRTLSGRNLLEALAKVVADSSAPEPARVEALRAIPLFDASFIEPILRAFDDPSVRLREAAAEAAGSAGPDRRHEAADRLIGRLDDPDLARRICVSLGDLRLMKSAPALIEAMERGALDARRAAYEALLKVAWPVEFAADPVVWKQWWEATHGAGALVARFESLVKFWNVYNPDDLADPDRFLRGSRAATKELERRRLAAEQYDRLRRLHVQDAVECPSPDLIRHLMARLAHASLAVRFFVAECLGRVADEPTRDELRAIVLGYRDAPAEARATCAYALAHAGPGEAASLRRALEDVEPIVRRAGCFALGKIGAAADAWLLLARLESDEDAGVRVEAARAIGRMLPRGDAELVRRAASRLRSELRQEVRMELCFALAVPSAAPELALARTDADERIRLAAAWALARSGAGGELERICSTEPFFQDREGAALGLGDLRDRARISFLCERMKLERHPKVRGAIADALGRIGARTPSVRDALLRGTEDQYELVRRSAYAALNRLCEGSIPAAGARAYLDSEEGRLWFEP
jgi:HEAT repeat protein